MDLETEKIIFCDHCSEMDKLLSYIQEQLRRKDHDLGILYKENGSLMDKISFLQKENIALKENLKQKEYPPLNATNIQSEHEVAKTNPFGISSLPQMSTRPSSTSLVETHAVQTVQVKTLNPLMADNLPKIVPQDYALVTPEGLNARNLHLQLFQKEFKEQMMKEFADYKKMLQYETLPHVEETVKDILERRSFTEEIDKDEYMPDVPSTSKEK